MKYEKHERNRIIKNIRMEMLSLVQQRKNLVKIKDKEKRKKNKKRIKDRMDTLEKRLDDVKKD